MGGDLSFEQGVGPRFSNPVRSWEDAEKLNAQSAGRLQYVADAIKVIQERLNGSIPLIGFAGAPFTILSYLVEVKSGSETLMHDSKHISRQLNQLKKSKKISFQSTNHFYYGMYYPDNQGDFYVFVKEQNSEFENQINRLLAIVVVVLLAAWTSIVVLAKVLSKIAYRPIKRVVEEVRNKEIATIHQPISSIDSGDELQELVDTYNALLIRVFRDLCNPKNFVSYVSHEFRTPTDR
ncbi:hypothetical protein FQR65_LT15185 [Abscondita terminalis]|nr:hypothetical protein FQR65_LT15185 [Abscondita terminalis]